MNASTLETAPLTRPAMRFILRHRRGVLSALDTETGQTVTGNVHYTVDGDGRLIGYLTRGEAILDAIYSRGPVSLTVERAGEIDGGEPLDEAGLPTEFALDRVQALVEVAVVDLCEKRIAGAAQPLATVTLDIYDIEARCRELAA